MLDHVASARPRIALDAEGWQAQALAALASTGTITAVAPLAQPELAAAFCACLATQPVESDYLLVHARLRAVRFEASTIEIDAEVVETVQ